MRAALLFLALAPVWAQTTAGPVTQIVTGGTVKVTGGTPVVSSGTSVVSGGTTVIGGGGAAPAVWTQIQSKWSPVTSSGTIISVTLTSAPVAGNLVVCGILAIFSKATSSVADNASTPNTYTFTPSSPSNLAASAAYASLVYLVAPSGAGATITATLGTALTIASAMGCEEFHLSAGTPGLDKDIAGHGSGGPGNTFNTPTITPSAANELLVGVAYMQGGATAAGSPWTLWPPGLMAGDGGTTNCYTVRACVFGDELILASTNTATTFSFTNLGTTVGNWNSIIAAFN